MDLSLVLDGLEPGASVLGQKMDRLNPKSGAWAQVDSI